MLGTLRVEDGVVGFPRISWSSGSSSAQVKVCRENEAEVEFEEFKAMLWIS